MLLLKSLSGLVFFSLSKLTMHTTGDNAWFVGLAICLCWRALCAFQEFSIWGLWLAFFILLLRCANWRYQNVTPQNGQITQTFTLTGMLCTHLDKHIRIQNRQARLNIHVRSA